MGWLRAKSNVPKISEYPTLDHDQSKHQEVAQIAYPRASFRPNMEFLNPEE
jgi:hypothetical protein